MSYDEEFVADRIAELMAERDAARAQVAILKGVRTAVLHTIGGTVEGRPTSEINFLQRLRELVAKEAERDAARAQVAALRAALAEISNECMYPINGRIGRVRRIARAALDGPAPSDEKGR